MNIDLFIQTYPKSTIIAFSLIITFLISLVNYFVLDKERMKQIKSRQKEIQEQMKKHQKEGNHEKLMELNKEMLSHVGETFRHSLKPMLITAIPILIFFAFLKNEYSQTTLAGSWFWWYFASAIIGSLFWRKVFKLP